MTQAANNYGQVLYELKVPKEMVEEAEVLFREVPQLKEALVSPVVKKSEKNRRVRRIINEFYLYDLWVSAWLDHVALL